MLVVLIGLTSLVLTFDVMLGDGWDSLIAVVLIDGLIVYLAHQDYKMKPAESEE